MGGVPVGGLGDCMCILPTWIGGAGLGVGAGSGLSGDGGVALEVVDGLSSEKENKYMLPHVNWD